MAQFVVGVDGSPPSVRALDFALTEAAAHQLPLTVVAVIPEPQAEPRWGLPHLHPSPEDVARTRRRVQEVVDAAVSRNEAVKAVDVRLHVVAGIPVEVLREEAGADDHLVLGSRGHRELRALFL